MLRAALGRPLISARASTRRTLFTPSTPKPLAKRLRSACYSTALVLGTGAFLVYSHDSRAGVHRWVFLPALGFLTADDPEAAHNIAVKFIGSGLAPVDQGVDDERLAVEVWGKKMSNPIGMAAGFDKHGEAIDGLFGLGFGYVEIGSITPQPQDGNPKPRVFRIPETNALINRYGFNSSGHESAIVRLRKRITDFVTRHANSLPSAIFPPPPPNALPNHDVVSALLESPAGQAARVVDAVSLPRSLVPDHVLAINLGKNKTSPAESVDDYVNGVKSLGPYADILVINVSSPNTPGLRNLQKREALESLLASVVAARDALESSPNPPVLVKIAPDLTTAELEDIAAAVVGARIDGIVISNTTISRPPSAGKSTNLVEAGGLSGPPVKPLALKALSTLYEATEGRIPLIGCGGISSGKDAVEFAKAGASLVQLYTGFIYEGIGLPRKMKDQVTEILKEEGKTWVDLIGSGIREAKAEEQRRRREAELLSIETMAGELEKVLEGLPPPVAETPTATLEVVGESVGPAVVDLPPAIIPSIPDPTEELFSLPGSTPPPPPPASAEEVSPESTSAAPVDAPSTPASAVFGLLDASTLEGLLEEVTKPFGTEKVETKKEEVVPERDAKVPDGTKVEGDGK